MTHIDLHIHSSFSDGKLTPKQIVDEAIKNGVLYFSIADHDTVGAYNDELYEYLKNKNLTIIPAVEISTKFEGVGVHILGYNFDLTNKQLLNKLYEIRNARHIYLSKVSKKLEELGYKVNFEELDKVDAVTKAHIALDVVNNKENELLLTKIFGHIPNKGEFIETIMNENCPAYVKKESVSPAEAAELIRNAGGKVVLAHPVAYAHEDGLTEADIKKIVESAKPDGLEAYYIYADKFNQKFNEIEKWKDFAKRHNLFTAIGSDFHDYDGVRPVIGFVGEDVAFSVDDMNKTINNLLNKKHT